MAPEPEDRRAAAATAVLTAAILEQGRGLDRLSLVLLLAACALLGLTAPSPAAAAVLAASIAAGLGQRCFALRSALDARLFGHWAHCWAGLERADPQADLDAFDAALGTLSGKTARPPRPLADRVQGALRLLRRQALALAIQLTTLLGPLVGPLFSNGAP